MALDPRIALMGTQWQAPDIQGAMRQGQEYRQNQMAMQAAQDTAARNTMVRQRATQVDYNDPASVNMFVREVGPDATPYLQAAGAGDTLFNTRAAERRSQGEFDIKRNEAGMTELRTVVGRVFNNPDDASLADAAQRYPQFAADINRIAANPDANARRTGLATLVASLPGGSEFLDAITQQFSETDLGGSILRTPKRSYLPGETQTLATSADPRAPTIFSSSQGVGQIDSSGSFTPVTGPGGAPVMPYQAPSRTDTADADARAGAAEGLRSTLDSLRGYYDALNRSGGIVSSGGVRQPDGTISAGRGGGENLVASAGASLPGRVLGRTFGSRDQTQRDNIQTAIPMIVASLKDLTGMSAQQMNSNVELQLFLGTVGDPSKSIETVNEALARFERYVDRVAGAQGGGGDVSAIEAEARRRGLIP